MDFKWPDVLQPQSFSTLTLGSSKFQIGMSKPKLPLWAGPPPIDTYGGKPIINLKDKPTFAELYLLQQMKDAGWEGVWIDSYKCKFRNAFEQIHEIDRLPELPRNLLAKILGHSDFPRTCWDLICWDNNGQIVFLEAKREAKDKIRDTQIRFVEKAVRCGVQEKHFLIVEWIPHRV